MPGAIRFAHAHDQAQVLQVGAHCLGPRPGYCTLTATTRPSLELGPVDLADRRRAGHRLVGRTRRNTSPRPLAQVAPLDQLAQCRSKDTRRGRPSRSSASLGLDALLELGRKNAPVSMNEATWADLHRRALHLAQHVEDLLGRLHLAARRSVAPAPPRSGSGWLPW